MTHNDHDDTMSDPIPQREDRREERSSSPVPGSANKAVGELLGAGICDWCGKEVEALLVTNHRGVAGLCSCQKCSGACWPNERRRSSAAVPVRSTDWMGDGDAIDRALTIQIIMREKASAPGRAYYVTEDEIRERQERELKSPNAGIRDDAP